MQIAITGASGLVGSALVAFLSARGDQVMRLVRGGADEGRGEVNWDPTASRFDAAGLAGVDAVVHLAGKNISDARWTESVKRRIRESRVDGTRVLCEGLARMDTPPRVLVIASAIGYYGDRGDEKLDETSVAGDGFLSEVCVMTEAATQSATAAGIRVVQLRIGIVLSADGGALGRLRLPFKLGVGGVIGDGRQYWSWIAIDDVIGAIQHVLTTSTLEGPVNAVAPDAPTNQEFTKTLGRVLRRPTILPIPAPAARLALGEMADEMLLASARVTPSRLLASGFDYEYPTLEGALRHALGED